MSKKRSSARKRIDEINSAIWLIGLGVLFLTDLFWPGILILAGIAMIVRSLMINNLNEEEESSEPPTVTVTPDEAPAPAPVVVPAVAAALPPAAPDPNAIPDPLSGEMPTPIPAFAKWLPEACPECGGPLVYEKMHWQSPSSAECPYCHTLVEEKPANPHPEA